MLSPEYLTDISETVIPIWDELNEWITSDIIRRLLNRMERSGDLKLTGLDQWQTMVYQEAGGFIGDLQQKIADTTTKSDEEVKRVFEESGIKTLEWEDQVYKLAGMNPAPFLQSPRLVQVMQSAYSRTCGELHNFTRTTAIKSQRLLIDELDKAYIKVHSGAQSYSSAAKEAVDRISKSGITVYYPPKSPKQKGHTDSIETAVIRAVRTGVSQGSGALVIERANEMKQDLVLSSSHLGARDKGGLPENHALWQGKVYSISGISKKYPKLEDATGYPNNPTGLCGYNCRHSFGVWIEGYSHNPYAEYDSEENKAVYKLSQNQRAREREIRKNKRIVQNISSAIAETVNEELKHELQSSYNKAALKLQKSNQSYNQFCEENGLKKQYDRIRTANWDRKQAAKARAAAKKFI